MNSSEKNPKLPIKIINTEELSKSPVPINILGKEPLPTKIITEARQHRESGKIDEAILHLRKALHQFSNNSAIEDELNQCFSIFRDEVQFQTVANGQLGKIFFDNAGFVVDGESFITSYLVETRLLISCTDADLVYTLEGIIGRPLLFFCYCLAECEKVLDAISLGTIQENFINPEQQVNRRVNFVICRESSPAINILITETNFKEQFTTIPLERDEMRHAVLNHTAADYLQSKLRSWLGNHRLFATTLPVARQDEFFGRQEDYKEIKQIIDRGNSFYIMGMRRIGKSSLIKHLHHMGAFRSYLYAYIDLERYMENSNFDPAIESIYQLLIDEFTVKQPAIAQNVIASIPENESAQERLLIFLDKLATITRYQKLELKCLIVLDDLNLVLVTESRDKSLWELGAKQLIRQLRSRREQVITGMTLWDFQTIDILESGASSGLGKYTSIFLKPLRPDECTAMITFIGSIINMEFEASSLEIIYAETGGHPFWTRLLCDYISSSRINHSAKILVKPEMVARAIEKLLAMELRLLKHPLDILEGFEKRALSILVQEGGSVNLTEPPYSIEPKTLIQLSNYGFIEETEMSTTSYRLRMGLLTRYLNMK